MQTSIMSLKSIYLAGKVLRLYIFWWGRSKRTTRKEIAAWKQGLKSRKSGLPGRVKACTYHILWHTLYFVSLELCSSLPCLRYQVGWSFRSPRPRQQSQTSCPSLAHLNGSNWMVSLQVRDHIIPRNVPTVSTQIFLLGDQRIPLILDFHCYQEKVHPKSSETC